MSGPTEPEAFDNPTGKPIYEGYGLPPEGYDSVFDFGCGCGRLARKLLQQTPRPHRYVGIDVHRGMIEWCKENLSPVDPNFRFFHHDVYAENTPQNSLRLALPFPVEAGSISLCIAHSVFTHLLRRQAEFYLHEIARILKPDGVAFTSWLFFDRASYPFLAEGPFNLFAGEAVRTEAVIYDRRWFLDLVRRVGLAVRATTRPVLAGHQWAVLLARRRDDTVDEFPVGEDGADLVCGATAKAMAAAPSPAESTKGKVNSWDAGAEPRWPSPPNLTPELSRIDHLGRQLEELRSSRTWRVGQACVAPARFLRDLLRR